MRRQPLQYRDLQKELRARASRDRFLGEDVRYYNQHWDEDDRACEGKQKVSVSILI